LTAGTKTTCMKKQHPLTLSSAVIPGRVDELEAKLLAVRRELETNPAVFEATGTIHYARLLLLKPDHHAAFPVTTLVFSTDYDGAESDHLAAIAGALGDFIDPLYDCCEGYPATRTPETRKKFLQAQRAKTDAFYAGAPRRSLVQIRQESQLRDFIWRMLKEEQWKGKTAQQVHRAIRQAVSQKEEFSWANEPISLPKNQLIPYIFYGVLILTGIGLLSLTALFWILGVLAVVFLFVAGWLTMLHYKYELNDKPLGLTPSRIDEKHVKILEEYEDIHNQNQFSQLIPMKPGTVRSGTLSALMLYARIRIFVEFVEGKLMGIPTIHFARWLRLDNGKQMLFFSNFDGSWQQYLGDFIDKSGWGLTAIFSNTENFPVTRYLFWGGAYDEEHFLAWSRYYQIPTQVWYCAYPKLSIKNINNNSAIRQELIRNLDEKQADRFLKRF
jgi:hypothetical protein